MNESEIRQKIAEAAKKVRDTKPLAPSITNTVTVNFVANAQIASGGSAAMVYLPDEGEFIAQVGDAVYINVGTLFPIYAETLPRTARTLHENKKNWVLDPVAIGIGSLRTELLRGFKQYPPTIVRGNASEIIALAKLWGIETAATSKGPSGVDSVDDVASAKSAAMALAKFIGGAVAVSGKTDFVTDGRICAYSEGGSHFMEKITGAGCSLGGVCAVFAAVTDPFTAALSATQLYNLAGKRAEAKSDAPASFQANFIDEVYKATPKDIAQNPCRFEEN
ncbi:MAG: hydroxyethylthiazole kinase [Treponema sp.]|nr:hydroxyethylthiazole kinase [Treponema sp.]